MSNIKGVIEKINGELAGKARLIAISKTHPVSLIEEAYSCGMRDFGENKVQELQQKQPVLPDDIRWHFIGHLQTNKVKYIAPYVYLIHTVDSFNLLKVIDKEAKKNNRVIDVLLEVHVAQEDTKSGLKPDELWAMLEDYSVQKEVLANVRICGLMAMASNTDDQERIEADFQSVEQLFEAVRKKYFDGIGSFNEISMGMSGDYLLALKHGATYVRVGSMIFGNRIYNNVQ